jgi:hypothetical protein
MGMGRTLTKRAIGMVGHWQSKALAWQTMLNSRTGVQLAAMHASHVNNHLHCIL